MVSLVSTAVGSSSISTPVGFTSYSISELIWMLLLVSYLKSASLVFSMDPTASVGTSGTIVASLG